MNEFKNVDDWRENYYNKLLDCRNELMTDFSLSQAYNGRTFSTYMLSFIEKHGVEESISWLVFRALRKRRCLDTMDAP